MRRIKPHQSVKLALAVCSLLASATASAFFSSNVPEDCYQSKPKNYPAADHPTNLCHQHWPSCCGEDHKEPINPVYYLRDNFPLFYSVVRANSAYSRNERGLNIMGLFALSGMANMDLIFTDRVGGITTTGDRSSVQYGVGIRPVFGEPDINFIGSINNVNLFTDFAINNWVLAHVELNVANACRKTAQYANDQRDWSSQYRAAAALKVPEVYLLLSNPACTPIYLQVGKFNSIFGDYDPYASTPTLTQLVTQDRTGGVIAGIIFDNGFYGKVMWSMDQQSLENVNNDNGSPRLQRGNKDRNYGVTIGLKQCFCNNLRLHTNVGYIADLRDSDFLTSGNELINDDLLEDLQIAKLLTNSYVQMDRAAGAYAHIDVDYCNVGFTINYVTALSKLNENSEYSRIRALDVIGRLSMPTPFFGCPSQLVLSYQHGDNADVHRKVTLGPVPTVPPIYNYPLGLAPALPHQRFTFNYGVQIMPRVSVFLEYVHDQDFGADKNGTDRGTNLALFRINAEF